MEPVELTIITRNKTKEGLEEIVRDTSKVGKTVEQVTADFKARMEEQGTVVKQVEADIRSLEKQLEKAVPGKAKMELAAELAAAKKVLAEEKGELAALERQVEQSAQKHITLRTEIRNLKEQMAGMTEGTEEYAAAMKQLGDLQDRMGDVNTQGRIFSDDNKNIKATMDAVSGLTGAMTAGVGVASLFGAEQEKLAQIQTRLQAVMAITMGIQQVANTLNKDSYFTHVLLTGSKDMLTAATTRLSVALGISNVAAQALMATLTLGLSAAITGLIYLWNKYTESTKKGQQELNDEIDRTKSALQGISEEVDFDVRVAEAAGKSKKELIELRKEAAKTALALADATYEKVLERHSRGKASKEQLAQAKEAADNAWKEYNKVMQDAVVADTEERTEKKRKSASFDREGTAEALAEAELRAQRKINDMTIALMKEGEEKKKELALKQFDDELERIDKEERERLKALQDAQKNGMPVTREQVATVRGQAAQQRNLAGEQYMQAYYEITREYADRDKELKEQEAQAWIDYNKEYGDYEEKRLAITQDYENRIEKARTEGGKASLQKRMEEELKNLDLENLKTEIDWTAVFGNLDKVSADALGRLKKQLREFIGEQKNLSPENIKELVEAIDKLDKEEKRRSPFLSISESFRELARTTKELKEAKRTYSKVLKEGTELEKKDAKAKLESAKAASLKAKAEATDSLHAGVDRLREYADEAGKVMTLMNEMGIKTPEWMAKSLEGVDDMLDGLSQIDLTKPMSIVTGGLKTVSGAVKTVGSLFKLGADYSEYNEMVKKYDTLMDVWDRLLDKKKAYIKESYGAEAAKAGAEALDLLATEREITKQLAASRLAAGKGLFSHSVRQKMWSGSHTVDASTNKGATNNGRRTGNVQWNDVNEAVMRGLSASGLGNVRFDGMYDMLDMTGEQLQWIKENYTGLWAAMDGDFRGYLENLIEYGEAEREILDSVKEQITGISFDSFKDSYLSMLSDLSLKNADFAKEFEKKLQESIMRSMLEKNYSARIKQLYDSWAAAGENGGYTREEVEELRRMQQELTDAMLAERDKMAAAFGWSADNSTGGGSSQSGRSGAITTITEETAGKIEGMVTSLQIHVIDMDDKLTDLSQYAYETIGILNTIAENTAFCRLLEDIAEAMERMDRDGIKMK